MGTPRSEAHPETNSLGGMPPSGDGEKGEEDGEEAEGEEEPPPLLLPPEASSAAAAAAARNIASLCEPVLGLRETPLSPSAARIAASAEGD